MKANEALSAFMCESDALEDRRIFVRNLGWLLSQTREGIIGCELEIERDEEHVAITFKDGYQRRVNVHMDSYAAIVRDVAKAI
ncbi:MAG: hypothetical protein IKG66_02515 [Lachnospiraceae bacterium]|nr:hypothetical protein [Lachnospiraceae bacterium]